MVAVLAGMGAGGCSGERGFAPRAACRGAVTVAATSESSPLFTWAPDCAVSRLRVVGPPNMGVSDVRWDVRGGQAGIASGVRYGLVPPGATQEVAPRTLSGTSLNVEVFSADGTRLGGVPLPPP